MGDLEEVRRVNVYEREPDREWRNNYRRGYKGDRAVLEHMGVPIAYTEEDKGLIVGHIGDCERYLRYWQEEQQRDPVGTAHVSEYLDGNDGHAHDVFQDIQVLWTAAIIDIRQSKIARTLPNDLAVEQEPLPVAYRRFRIAVCSHGLGIDRPHPEDPYILYRYD